MSESDRRVEDAFVRIEIRASGERAERALAEVWEAGASGVEELTGELIVVYAPRAKAEAVRAAAAIGLGDAGAVGRAVAVDDRRWSEEWKRHLQATTISPRLRIRPPFIEAAGRAGQVEVVVEPGQAFGLVLILELARRSRRTLRTIGEANAPFERREGITIQLH